MALLGTSLILASLSLALFRWSPTTWLSWIRPQKGRQPLPPPHHPPSKTLHPATISKQDYIMNGDAAGSDETTTVERTNKETSKTGPSIPKISTTPLPSIQTSIQHSATDPDKSVSSVNSNAQLMPPPPRPQKSAQKLALSAVLSPQSSANRNANSLRPPLLGSSPNRTASLAATARGKPAPLPTSSTMPAAHRPRKKVILAPGHSPLDWANLTAISPASALSGVASLQRVTPSQLKTMNGRKGRPAWSAYQGRVYNIEPYLPFHPGGEGEIMRGAGKEAGTMFEEVHPWVNWEAMMGPCVVGILVGESETLMSGGNADDMD